MKHKNYGGLAGKYRRIYRIWHGMRERCLDTSSSLFANYGGRGITVFDDWESFPNFLDWALCSGYEPTLSLDRIDNNGGYSPKNCRWATPAQQAHNRRTNVMVGDLCAVEASRAAGMPDYIISKRLRAGWTMDRAVSEPVQNKKPIIRAFGQAKTLTEWAESLGIPRNRIYLRLKRGWTPEAALC